MPTSLLHTYKTRLYSLFTLLLILGGLHSITPALAAPTLRLINGIDTPYPAPLLMGITRWANSTPVSLHKLHGKVVLIEFWTASCPYCKLALPYVNAWYNRYHNQGLFIIGIHSPKNEGEQSVSVVKAAIARHDIRYPVALDNNFETWQNYNAEGWPSFYLIDKKGNIVYASYGAQNYEIIENNILFLLNQDAQ